MKLLWLIALLCIVFRLVNKRWPWQSATSLQRSREMVRARALLGVGAGASRCEVVDAHRHALAMVHPDRGGTSDQVHEVNAARDLILAELDQVSQERR